MDMNDISNDELKELLEKFLKRLDVMDKDRDQMINKLRSLSKAVKDINMDLDELFKVMDGNRIEINFEDSPMENEQLEELSLLIQKNKDEFDDEDYLSIVHSVLGEA